MAHAYRWATHVDMDLAPQGDAWTPVNLDGFLENPGDWAPGTTMGFAGLNKAQDRADVIAYLDSLDD